MNFLAGGPISRRLDQAGVTARAGDGPAVRVDRLRCTNHGARFMSLCASPAGFARRAAAQASASAVQGSAARSNALGAVHADVRNAPSAHRIPARLRRDRRRCRCLPLSSPGRRRQHKAPRAGYGHLGHRSSAVVAHRVRQHDHELVPHTGRQCRRRGYRCSTAPPPVQERISGRMPSRVDGALESIQVEEQQCDPCPVRALSHRLIEPVDSRLRLGKPVSSSWYAT